MPQKTYLIRHGETEYNKTRRLQGWLDIPLNETGHAQAVATAEKLRSHTLHALYSSDLRRAHETATYVSTTLGLTIQTTEALRETDMGIFAGWAWESDPDPIKEQLWTEFEHARDHQLLDWNAHQGESIGAMLTRITTFLDTLPANHPNEAVGLVTHGGTINRILEYYNLKSSLDGFHMIRNASIQILTKQPHGYSLEVI